MNSGYGKIASLGQLREARKANIRIMRSTAVRLKTSLMGVADSAASVYNMTSLLGNAFSLFSRLTMLKEGYDILISFFSDMFDDDKKRE